MMLTRDEIMALTGEELREKIAEILGYKRFDVFGWHTWRKQVDGNYVEIVHLPNWPNDLSAAWSLLDGCRARSLEETTKGWFKATIYGYAAATANTAPLAICRVWLMRELRAQ